MTVDYEKLHTDLIIKAAKEEKSHVKVALEMELSPSIFFRLQNGTKLMLESYLKIVKWLEKDVSHYVTNKK
mgnify:CR=1 FL=1